MIYITIGNKYSEFINYAVKTCDTFSFIAKRKHKKRSLQHTDDIYYHQMLLNDLQTYLKLKKLKVSLCPPTGTTFRNSDMFYFECNKHTLNKLLLAQNIFDWNGDDFPEELCFYRGGENWFSCVCHERLVFINNETESDIAFLKKEGFEFTYGI